MNSRKDRRRVGGRPRSRLWKSRNELISTVSLPSSASPNTPPAFRAIGSHGMALSFGRTAVKERGRRDYPATKGRAGGKLPAGNGALRSPAFDASAAVRNVATNHT